MRTAIVTGASRGLGRAFAIGLAKDGFALGLAARDAGDLEDTAEAARRAGSPLVVTHTVDLSLPDSPALVVQGTIEKTGSIDALVNNAGATKRGDFLALSNADFIDGFGLKFHATVRFCRAAWDALVATKGTIVNIAGVGAHTPEPDFTIGGPVNSAIVNFTKAIAKRSQGTGMRINTLCPGHIVTERLQKRIDTLARERAISVEQAREQMRISQEIARYGTPEEVADVVRFLCSPAAAYVHGAVINVDGGATPGI